MFRRNHCVAAGLVVISIGLAGCGVGKADYGEVSQEGPAHVAPVAGNSDINQVTLTPEAFSKLGLTTTAASGAVMPASTDGSTPETPDITVPISAVIYDKDGKTWVYVVDGNHSYQRQAVTIKSVDGDSAILSSGPKAGVQVVTVGAQELLGAELGVAGE